MIKVENNGRSVQISVEDETVKTFIDYMLNMWPKNSGHFGIRCFDPQDMGDLLWGNPRCEYDKGEAKELPEKYLRKKIKRVRCEGDPKHRDYLITV